MGTRHIVDTIAAKSRQDLPETGDKVAARQANVELKGAAQRWRFGCNHPDNTEFVNTQNSAFQHKSSNSDPLWRRHLKKKKNIYEDYAMRLGTTSHFSSRQQQWRQVDSHSEQAEGQRVV